jgi:hypothetical protein
MAASLLNSLANISASTPVVLSAHLSAGTNRWLCVTIGMRNGAGNAQLPSSVSIGGVPATYLAGEPTANATARVTTGTWGINEAGIAALALNGGSTGYDVTMSGQSGTIRTVLTFSVADAAQTAPSNINNIFTATSAGATSLPLTRVASSFTYFVAYCETVTTLTLAEPTRDTTFVDSGNGTQFNIGYEADTARTANSTYSALAGRVSAHVINFAPAPAQAITGINGGAADAVVYGQPFTMTTTGYGSPVNAITIAGVACSGVSGTGGTAPALTDGATVPTPGTRQLTATNASSESANRNISVGVASGQFAQLLSGTLSTGVGSIIKNFSPAAVAADFIIHPTDGGTIVDASGRIKTSFLGQMQFVHLAVDSENPQRAVARTYMVITAEGQDPVVIPAGKAVPVRTRDLLIIDRISVGSKLANLGGQLQSLLDRTVDLETRVDDLEA